MVLGWSPFRIVYDNPSRQPRWLPLLKIDNSAKIQLKIIFSVTAGSIGPKLWLMGLQMVLFENCVRWLQPPTKIAAVTGNRKLLGQLGPNYGGMVYEWSSFIIMSSNPGHQPVLLVLIRYQTWPLNSFFGWSLWYWSQSQIQHGCHW